MVFGKHMDWNARQLNRKSIVIAPNGHSALSDEVCSEKDRLLIISKPSPARASRGRIDSYINARILDCAVCNIDGKTSNCNATFDFTTGELVFR